MSGAEPRWWQRLGRGQRVVVVAAAAVVAVNLALSGAHAVLGNDPGGPTSSSFSTGGSGLEGYADLLAAEGHPVVRLQARPTVADLPPTATVVLADPAGIDPVDVRRLHRFVGDGGRLVVAGEGGAAVAAALTGRDLAWYATAPVQELEVWVPVEATGSARTIAGDAGGRWGNPGPLVPVAGAAGAPSLLIGAVGRGHLIALADASVLQNANLDRADNAALGLAAAGASGRGVVFLEPPDPAVGSGMAAVPRAWRWAGGGLAVALAAGLWSAAARFGPPEPARRTLRPPRLDHVEAVAADLDRVTTTPDQAVGPLARSARGALAERLGVPTDASSAVLHAAAGQAGVDAREVDLLSTPRLGLADALAVGELAARRQQLAHERPTSHDLPGATP